MPFPVIPVAIGGGVMVLAGIGLRMRALSKQTSVKPSGPPIKATAPVTGVNDTVIQPAAINGPTVVSATTIRSAAAQARGQSPPAPIRGEPTMDDLLFSLNDPVGYTKSGRPSFDLVTIEDSGAAKDLLDAQGKLNRPVAAPSNTAAGGTTLPSPPTGKKAIVTTKDPSPAGDLIVRDRPNGSQIGGADKDGTVTILQDVDVTWAKVSWAGGRWPAVEGFSRKAFLRVV